MNKQQRKACRKLEEARRLLESNCCKEMTCDLVQAIDKNIVALRGGLCNPLTGENCG